MDLNTFGSDVVKHLSRLANAAEGIEAQLKGGKPPVGAKDTAADKPAGKTTAAKGKTNAAKPTKTRDELKAALVAVKDTISKDAAQKVYQPFGYEAMSAIEEKDFDAIFAAAEKALAEHEAGGDDAGDDDL